MEGAVSVKNVIVILVLSTLAFAAQASQQWCTGTIKAEYASVDGSLYIWGTYRSEWTQVCNLMVTWKGVDPNMCKQWHAMTMTLRVTSEPVTVYYYDLPSCAAIPYYSDAPAPGYVMINER